MAIECKLSTIMGAKRIKMRELSRATGISMNTISELYHNRAIMVSYKTLSRLCDYFHCTPNDILSYTEDTKPHTNDTKTPRLCAKRY